MHKIVAAAALALGLLAGTSTLTFAAPSMHAAGHRDTASRSSSSIERADYYYHHHRYHHRAWDRRHHRWRYW
jgi:hypothetical protein